MRAYNVNTGVFSNGILQAGLRVGRVIANDVELVCLFGWVNGIQVGGVVEVSKKVGVEEARLKQRRCRRGVFLGGFFFGSL
jgi:hypothetical protein